MRDRDLVRLYWPVELRPAFDALFAIDDAMAEIVATSTQPALGAIRLAWWRDALERLDTAAPQPEPRLQAVASELLSRGVARPALAGIAESWSTFLDEHPDPDLIAGRGTALFAAGACLLQATDAKLLEAGARFAFADAKRRGLFQFHAPGFKRRFAKPLRPLTAFAALAERDLRQDDVEPEATPARAVALLRHRLFGSVG